MALAAHPLIEFDDPLLDQNFPSGDSLRVRVRSEGDKININFLVLNENAEPLRRLFRTWGMDSDHGRVLADRIFDWIDADDLARLNGSERSDYLDDGNPVAPLNRSAV